MITTERKPLSEILDIVKGSKNILIVACGGCVAVYKVGGKPEAEALSEKLREQGVISDVIFTPRQCDEDMVDKAISPIAEKYDLILSTACGVGVQTIADILPKKLVAPALNTKFIGRPLPEKFQEVCSACGNCILYETGGICPITRCPKGLLNGPCGGQMYGKCEVGRVRNCAWILIYERLKAQNRLDLLREFRVPKDYRLSSPPREAVRGGE